MEELVEAVTDLGKNLKCPICLSLLREPTTMACSHSYCKECVGQAIGARGLCPICKMESTRRELVPNDHLARFVKLYKELVAGEEKAFPFSQPYSFSQVLGSLSKQDFAPIPVQKTPKSAPKRKQNAAAGGTKIRPSQLLMTGLSQQQLGKLASPSKKRKPAEASPAVAAADVVEPAAHVEVPCSELLPSPLYPVMPSVPPTLIITTSGLAPVDQERLLKLVAVLGEDACELSAKFTDSVTHLIVPVKKGIAQKRSIKYVQAILSKAFIVGPEWLTACLKAKRPVDEGPFVVNGVHQDTIMGGPARAMSSKLPLFSHWRMALRGAFLPPTMSRAELADLLMAAGAAVVKESELPATEPRCVIVCDAEVTDDEEEEGPPAVHFKWFLDCVSSYTVLPFNHSSKRGSASR